MEYGTAAGLAYVHDWNAEQQMLLQQEGLDRQAAHDAENKAAYWGDKIKFGKAYTKYGQEALKNYTTEQFKKIGEMTRSNPNWMYNPMMRAQINHITSSISDNDITNRELRAEKERELLVRDMASGEMDPSDFEGEMQKYQNYAETGNTDGIPGLEANDFMYIKPPQVDVNKILDTTIGAIEANSTIRSFNNGTHIGIASTRSEKQLRAAAAGLIFGKEGRAIQRWFDKEKAAKRTDAKDAAEFLYQGLQARNGYDIKSLSQVSTGSGRRGSGNSEIKQALDYYAKDFVPNATAGKTQFDDVAASQLIPTGANGEYTLQGGLRVRGMNKFGDGKQTVERVDSWDGQAVKIESTGRNYRFANGVVYHEYTTKIPANSRASAFMIDSSLISGNKNIAEAINANPQDYIDNIKPELKAAASWEQVNGKYTGNLNVIGLAPLTNISQEGVDRYNQSKMSQNQLAELRQIQSMAEDFVETDVPGIYYNTRLDKFYDAQGNEQ